MKRKVKISRFIVSMLTLGFATNNIPIEIIAADEAEYTTKETEESSKEVEESSDNTEEIIEEIEQIIHLAEEVEEIEEDYTESSETLEITETVIYISDLIEDDLTYTQWESGVIKDSSKSGDNVHLLINGEEVVFTKGIGAESDAQIVYDVSEYSETYTHLVGYVGVDYRQASNGGDGVDFSIETSDDGVNWTEVQDIGVVKSSDEAYNLYVNISGAKYIRLNALKNKTTSYDHAVFADLRLVDSSYDSSESEYYIGLKTVAEYDEIISSYSIDENISNNEHLILQRTLVNRFGLQNLQSIYGVEEYREGLDFLANNELALKYFVTNGDITIEGEYLKTLKAFCSIYNEYKDDLLDSSDDYFNLRLAISISLAYSRDVLVSFWVSSNKPIDAVTRYEVYQRLVASGIMDEAGDTETYGKWSTELFKALPIPLMKWVVDIRMNDDEIEWLADYVLSKKTSTTSSSFLDAYSYITYTTGYNYSNSKYFDLDNYDTYNEKYNFGDYYDDYGTSGVYRLWMVFEEGAVCGGLAKTYANIAEVFGRPSSVAWQPGHAATLTYGWNSSTNQYEWYLQNDIYGWQQSGNEYADKMLNWGNKSWSTSASASYLLLTTDAIETEEAYNKYIQATILNLLADVYDDLDIKEELYKKALDIQNINLDSFEGLVEVYKANSEKTSEDYLELARMIVDAYTYYPLVMTDLLNYMSDGITNSYDKVVFDLIKNNALTKASSATIDDVKQPSVCTAMANYIIGNNVTTDLASFSFDGDNAGCIVIDEAYDSTEIRVKYSLDGGNYWIETSEHIIVLTEEEISSITSGNDILVGLVGVNEIFTIDILDGEKISTSYITKNDVTNTLEGKIENLQFSIDDGVTWNDYTSDITFEGDQVVKVRYKAYGVYLQGEEDQFTFTENNEEDDRKLISFDDLTVIDYSTQQSDSYAATGIIDSNPFTTWHTKYNYTDPDKYVTVQLDTERYISAIEYEPAGQNGRFKSIEVYVSLDNENWDLVVSVEGLANNTSIKNIDFPNSVLAKYVKIAVTESYGNSSTEVNMYASGKTIYFYEDTTKIGSDNEENTTAKGIVLSNANFSDSYIRKAIASALEISEGDIIWNIEDITELELVDTSYTTVSLSGLDLFTGLTKLGITGIKANLTVDTLSSINNLTNLTDLSLSFYRITSGYNADSISTVMNELTNLTELTTLNLHSRYNDNTITSTDATSLQNFTKLKELQITNDNGKIVLEEGAISDLFELEKLTIKSSSGVKVSSSETVESISELPNLKYLDLSGSKLSKLENLIDFSNLSLEYLDLSNNSLTSIESLKDLRIVGSSDGKVGEVYLYGNSGLNVSEYINLPKASEGEVYKLYSEPNVDLSSLSDFVFYVDEDMTTLKTDWNADSGGIYTVSYVTVVGNNEEVNEEETVAEENEEEVNEEEIVAEENEEEAEEEIVVEENEEEVNEEETVVEENEEEAEEEIVVEENEEEVNEEEIVVEENEEEAEEEIVVEENEEEAEEEIVVEENEEEAEEEIVVEENEEEAEEEIVVEENEEEVNEEEIVVEENEEEAEEETVVEENEEEAEEEIVVEENEEEAEEEIVVEENEEEAEEEIVVEENEEEAEEEIVVEENEEEVNEEEIVVEENEEEAEEEIVVEENEEDSRTSSSITSYSSGGRSTSIIIKKESTEEEIEEEIEAEEEETIIFEDIENHWAKDYLYDLYEKGVISAYPDGTFRPENNTTRGEIAVLVCNLLSYLGLDTSDLETERTNFKDVDTSKYYYNAVQVLNSLGIISGYTDGSFNPSGSITREEFVMLLYNVINKGYVTLELEERKEFTDSNKVSSWCKEAFDYINSVGLISGYTDGSFRPKDKITRAEVITILYKVLN